MEGYYRDTIGEIISFSVPHQNDDDNDNSEKKQEDSFIRFKVLGIIGKGVFSTVLKCVHVDDPITMNINNGQQSQQTQPPQPPQVVALKLIRNNETMAKAAQKEVRILRILSQQEQQQQPIIDNNVVASVGKKSDGESDLLPPSTFNFTQFIYFIHCLYVCLYLITVIILQIKSYLLFIVFTISFVILLSVNSINS